MPTKMKLYLLDKISFKTLSHLGRGLCHLVLIHNYTRKVLRNSAVFKNPSFYKEAWRPRQKQNITKDLYITLLQFCSNFVTWVIWDCICAEQGKWIFQTISCNNLQRSNSNNYYFLLKFEVKDLKHKSCRTKKDYKNILLVFSDIPTLFCWINPPNLQSK